MTANGRGGPDPLPDRVCRPRRAVVGADRGQIGRRLRDELSKVAGKERGSAIVEFVFLSVVMMVPLIYLVLMLARLQAGAYAVSGAAREAGRAYVTATAGQQAQARAEAAAGVAFADHGFAGIGVLRLSCDGSPCLRPDGRVTVVAEVSVPLPFVPAFVADVIPTSVPMTATHVATVDRFRATG